MQEPPALADGTIAAALQAAFGIRVAELAFLPVGNDAASWSYRVETPGGPPRFLKVRAAARTAAGAETRPEASAGAGARTGTGAGAGASAGAGTGAMPGAEVAGYLSRCGVPLVLGPLLTGAGEPFVLVGRFALALYPMLDARPGGEAGLSPAQWRQLGGAVARLHAVAPTAELAGLVGREAFRPSRRELLPRLQAALAAASGDPVAAGLAACWRDHRDAVAWLVERADRLGRRLAQTPAAQVLCHADLHTWNVLVDADQRLWIVDWDEAVLAPRERDLMFVVGGIGRGLVDPDDTDRFLEGYGEARVDPVALDYYRCAWAVQDIAAYAEQALLDPGAGERTRRAAVVGFQDLFAPGNIVELASAASPPG